MQLSIFVFSLSTDKVLGCRTNLRPYSLSLAGWWAQMDFLAFGCFTTKWPRHFSRTVPNGTLVGSNGLGPSTSRLSGVCSNQLSYEPILVEVIGFEPMTPCLQGRCSTS